MKKRKNERMNLIYIFMFGYLTFGASSWHFKVTTSNKLWQTAYKIGCMSVATLQSLKVEGKQTKKITILSNAHIK